MIASQPLRNSFSMESRACTSIVMSATTFLRFTLSSLLLVNVTSFARYETHFFLSIFTDAFALSLSASAFSHF